MNNAIERGLNISPAKELDVHIENAAQRISEDLNDPNIDREQRELRFIVLDDLASLKDAQFHKRLSNNAISFAEKKTAVENRIEQRKENSEYAVQFARYENDVTKDLERAINRKLVRETPHVFQEDLFGFHLIQERAFAKALSDIRDTETTNRVLAIKRPVGNE